jgi:hypothetical protein
MSFPELEVLNSHVSRIFRVEDVTAGDPRQWIVRYRGHFLSEDTVAAYDQLAGAVTPYGVTPLFRKEEGDEQVVYLVSTPVIPKTPARIVVNVILFILTVISIMLMGVDVPPESLPADGSFPIMLLLKIYINRLALCTEHDGYPVRPRNGTLHSLPLLQRSCHVAVLHPCAILESVGNVWSIHHDARHSKE